jgi:hypothetical protein
VEKPTNAHFNLEHKTSLLFFEDGKSGEYYVRGSVCFPMLVEHMVNGKVIMEIDGFSMLAAQDVESKAVYIFEQQPFNIIDPIIEDGVIKHQGIARWFNRNWNIYYGRKYFYSDNFETAKKYRLDISRSKQIEPKPQLIEIITYQDEDMVHLIWQYMKLKRLFYEAGSTVHKALKDLNQTDKKVPPVIFALQLLLCGLDRHPYRVKGE